MFNKIKEYFNLNTKYPKCNCVSIKDQEIVIAESIHLSTILRIKVMDSSLKLDFSYVWNGKSHVSIDYGVGKCIINDKLCYSLYNKKACITCGTCLGWYNSKGQLSDPYVIADDIIKKATESYDKFELAKKICKGE